MLYVYLMKQAIYSNLGIWETSDRSVGLRLIDAIGEFFGVYYRHILGDQLIAVHGFSKAIHIVMKRGTYSEHLFKDVTGDDYKEIVPSIDYLMMALTSSRRDGKDDLTTELIDEFKKDFDKNPHRYLSPFLVMGSFISLSRECVEKIIGLVRENEEVDESLLEPLQSLFCNRITQLIEPSRLKTKTTDDPKEFKVTSLSLNPTGFDLALDDFEINPSHS